MEKLKELLKEVNTTDWIIVGGIVLALVVGVLTFSHFRQTADKQIEATATIGFQVFLRGVTLTTNESPILPNSETFITIRNVPYTNLKVADVRIDSKKTVMPNPRGGKEPFVMVDDYSQAFLYDMVVTIIVDKAKITKDGAVIGGNKIKIGLPVTLEGPSYKLNGTVSDVRILQPTAPQGGQPQYGQQAPQQVPQQGALAQPNVNKQEGNMG